MCREREPSPCPDRFRGGDCDGFWVWSGVLIEQKRAAHVSLIESTGYVNYLLNVVSSSLILLFLLLFLSHTANRGRDK